MLKHMLCACKISQCDNKQVIQITQTWFESDRTGWRTIMNTHACMHRCDILTQME